MQANKIKCEEIHKYKQMQINFSKCKPIYVKRNQRKQNANKFKPCVRPGWGE